MAKNKLLACLLAFSLFAGLATCDGGTIITHVGDGPSTSTPSNASGTVTQTTTTYEYTTVESTKAAVIWEKAGTEGTGAGETGGSETEPQPTIVSSTSTTTIQTTNTVSPEVIEKMSTSSVSPAQIFSANISTASNIVVNPSIQDGKILYSLGLAQSTSSAYSSGVSPQPVISLNVNQPIEIMPESRTINIGSDQVIDYSAVSSQSGEIISPVETRIGSSAYTITVAPESAFVNLAASGGKSSSVPVYSDVKIENRTVYLVEDSKDYQLKVSPEEIYSGTPATYSSGEVKSVSLSMENQRPVYSVNASEDFSLLWIIPMKIDAHYSIDGSNGEIISQEKPWFAFLGG